MKPRPRFGPSNAAHAARSARRGMIASAIVLATLVSLATVLVLPASRAQALTLTPASDGPNNAGQKLLLSNEAVSVEFVSVSAGFNNQFGKAKPNPADPSYTTDILYFLCQSPTPPGTTFDAGTFSGSQELVFYLKTSESTPHTWFSGPGNRNSDGEAHARMTQTNATTVRLAWEDQNEQGDHDFNDCVVDVLITPLATSTPTKTSTGTATNTATSTATPTETPVPNQTPVAAFALDPSEPTEGETIQFQDLSFDPDPTDEIIDWSWEIEDQILDSQNPLYLFSDDLPDNGIYPVTLTVKSSDGTTASTTLGINIENLPPLVNALDVEALAGVEAPIVARFVDPGWDDTHTADVALGGSPVTVVLQEDNEPAYASGIVEGVASSEGSGEGNAAVEDDDNGVGVDGYDFTIVPADPNLHEPIDLISSGLEDAPALESDASYLAYIQTPGDVDFYEVMLPGNFALPPGSEVVVTLRDVPADYDLALLSMSSDGTTDPGDSGEASFSTAPFTRSPFTRSPFTRSPFTRSPFTRSPFTRSPFTRSSFTFDQLPLSQLAFTGLEGDEIIGTDIGLGELGLNVIEAPNVRIAGFSAKRGLATETALGRTSVVGDRMFIAVVGYNGEFQTASPYRLQIEASSPLDLEALLGSAACTGTPLVPSAALGQTLVGSGTTTLFVTQRERMIAIHGQVAWDAMMTELTLLAGHAAVDGDIVSLPSGIYDAWDVSPCSIEAANAVTDVIAGIIDVENSGYDYVVFVGDDGVVPFRREPDETAISNERDYAIDSFMRQGSPLFASIALGYNLTDDFYVDVDPIAWQGRKLYVPDVPIGRLVETPAEILATSQAFRASNGQLNAQTGFVSGYDFFTDGSQATASSLSQGLQTTSLINDTWDSDDLRCGFLGLPVGPCAATTVTPPPPDISAPNAHMTHYAGLSANGFTTFDLEDFLASSEVAGSPLLAGALAFSMGCHAGFNAPDRDSVAADPGLGIDPAMDFAQAMAVQRAIWIASTGVGLGDTVGLGGTEELMAIFAEDLTAGSATAGGALVTAKQSYINGKNAKTVYDEKSTIQTTLYGLPMYQLNVPQSGGSLTTAAVPSGLTLTIFDGDPSPTVTVVPYQEVTTADGTFIAADGKASSTAARAVQPKVVLEDVTQPLDVPVHGALLFGGAYEDLDVPPFNPVIARPAKDWDVNVLEPQVCLQSFWPSELSTVNTLVTLNGLLQSVVVTPAQFRCDTSPPVVGLERLYTDLTFELLRCDDMDFVGPTVHSIELLSVADGDDDGDGTVHATIDASDASGIERIVGLVFSGGFIVPTFLPVAGGGPFEIDVLDVKPDDLMVFLVQDGACNVTWATGKGAKLKTMLIDAGPDAVYVPETPIGYTTTIFNVAELVMPLYYEWNFGDGTIESATLQLADLDDGLPPGSKTFTVNHAYSGVIAGTADVTVLDAGGGIATDAVGFACDEASDDDADLLSICDELARGTDPFDTDTDGDGCADGEEVLNTVAFGGGRDPLNPSDFFDVNGDQVVDAADVGLVRMHFNPVKPTAPGDEIYDRRAGTAPWAPGAPNGVINALDIALVRASFNHSCEAPP